MFHDFMEVEAELAQLRVALQLVQDLLGSIEKQFLVLSESLPVQESS
jgi:hypothetical protein